MVGCRNNDDPFAVVQRFVDERLNGEIQNLAEYFLLNI